MRTKAVVSRRGQDTKQSVASTFLVISSVLEEPAEKTLLSPWCGLGVFAQVGKTLKRFHNLHARNVTKSNKTSPLDR